MTRLAEDHDPDGQLLVALVSQKNLEIAVPRALDILSRDPLTRVHFFMGDLLRCLMEVPDAFWRHHTNHYQQYLAAVRAGAQARLQLPAETRFAFWSPLDLRELS